MTNHCLYCLVGNLWQVFCHFKYAAGCVWLWLIANYRSSSTPTRNHMQKRWTETSVLLFHILLHFVSRCYTVGCVESYSLAWHNDHGRTRTYLFKKLNYPCSQPQHSHRLYFHLYQNKFRKIVPQFHWERYDKYLQGYMGGVTGDGGTLEKCRWVCSLYLEFPTYTNMNINKFSSVSHARRYRGRLAFSLRGASTFFRWIQRLRGSFSKSLSGFRSRRRQEQVNSLLPQWLSWHKSLDLKHTHTYTRSLARSPRTRTHTLISDMIIYLSSTLNQIPLIQYDTPTRQKNVQVIKKSRCRGFSLQQDVHPTIRPSFLEEFVSQAASPQTTPPGGETWPGFAR